jgi:predicted O-linked N-acetylglucosamine transferase (SPINDLY family)
MILIDGEWYLPTVDVALMGIDEAFALAMELHRTGRSGEAAALYERILAVAPDYAQAHYNQGISLKALGRKDQAIAAFQRAVSLRPDFAEAHFTLANTLAEMGNSPAAIQSYRQAIAARPTYAQAYNNLALRLHQQGELAEAIALLRKAAELAPNLGEVLQNLGNALRDAGQIDEAVEAHRRVLDLLPDRWEGHIGLGNALREAGRVEEAIEAYRVGLERAEQVGGSLVSRCSLTSNLLFTLHYHPDYDRKRLWEEHVRWNQTLVKPLVTPISGHPKDRSPSRRLRLGYVSPDFSQGPIGRFMLPLLANHDHGEFEVFCYSDLPKPDFMTGRLRACADLWRETSAASNEQMVELVRQDAIDILVDLSLHTRGNRLLVFARKPAPVQVSYLAYCGTTGLETIEFRLTDSFMDPEGDSDSYSTERLVRLPHCFWCCQPHLVEVEQLDVGELPALREGLLTFGCLNNFAKVNAQTFAAWMRLLQQVPRSRLVLSAAPGEHRTRAWKRFDEEGLDPRRLWFVGFLPTVQYFQQYQLIDVALDPFPYGGGTTTFDALWMGVPVVTLAGQTGVSRAGLSILSNLQVAELAASNWDDYIRIAANLAADLPRLAQLRSTLRDRMKSSPLMDAAGFTRAVEAAFTRMWREFCSSPA